MKVVRVCVCVCARVCLILLMSQYEEQTQKNDRILCFQQTDKYSSVIGFLFTFCLYSACCVLLEL